MVDQNMKKKETKNDKKTNKTKQKKKRGFTLIELLAVIIILGVLMVIAVPAVTSYINNSRKSAYVNAIDGIVGGSRLVVNGGGLDFSDPDVTYYIETDYIKTDKTVSSPYGKLEKAYVIVVGDNNGHTYYFTGVDDTGVGVKNIVKSDVLNEDDIENDISTNSITPNIGIGTRSKIKIIKQDGTIEEGNVRYNVSENGGERLISNVVALSNTLCKRATSLHRISCSESEFGCEYSTTGSDYAFVFGNESVTSGVLTSGDAFDCDVNNDGVYDSTNERFYYLTSSGNKASLIYYANVIYGTPNNEITTAYNMQYAYGYTDYDHSEYNDNWHGPGKAFIYLPDMSFWSNPNLILPGTRQIVNETGGITTDSNSLYGGPNTITSFSYWDKAARLLTYQEVAAACGTSNITSANALKNCSFLFENTKHVYSSYPECYWLETPSKNSNNHVWIVNSDNQNVTTFFADVENQCNVRPVISIYKTNMEY